jgi:hypothetical protein
MVGSTSTVLSGFEQDAGMGEGAGGGFAFLEERHQGGARLGRQRNALLLGHGSDPPLH